MGYPEVCVERRIMWVEGWKAIRLMADGVSVTIASVGSLNGR